MATDTALAPPPATGTFRAAAARIVDRTLARNASLFTAERRLWTPDALTALVARISAARDGSGGTFAERWQHALQRVPPAQRLLAAELLYVHLVFAADLRAETKRDLVATTLAPLRQPVTLPAALDAALTTGVAGTGVAFTRRRLSQLSFLTRAYADWKARTASARRESLADPWAFKAWLVSVPAEGGQAQREALLHLVHPETFEPIVSLAVKARLAASHAEHVPADVTDVDAQLAAIRASLTPRHGPGFALIELDVGND